MQAICAAYARSKVVTDTELPVVCASAAGLCALTDAIATNTSARALTVWAVTGAAEASAVAEGLERNSVLEKLTLHYCKALPLFTVAASVVATVELLRCDLTAAQAAAVGEAPSTGVLREVRLRECTLDSSVLRSLCSALYRSGVRTLVLIETACPAEAWAGLGAILREGCPLTALVIGPYLVRPSAVSPICAQLALGLPHARGLRRFDFSPRWDLSPAIWGPLGAWLRTARSLTHLSVDARDQRSEVCEQILSDVALCPSPLESVTLTVFSVTPALRAAFHRIITNHPYLTCLSIASMDSFGHAADPLRCGGEVSRRERLRGARGALVSALTGGQGGGQDSESEGACDGAPAGAASESPAWAEALGWAWVLGGLGLAESLPWPAALEVTWAPTVSYKCVPN